MSETTDGRESDEGSNPSAVVPLPDRILPAVEQGPEGFAGLPPAPSHSHDGPRVERRRFIQWLCSCGAVSHVRWEVPADYFDFVRETGRWTMMEPAYSCAYQHRYNALKTQPGTAHNVKIEAMRWKKSNNS